jgi:regulatory protein
MKRVTAIGEGDIEALNRTEISQRGYDAALRYLDYRPRSQAELKGRLSRRGFDDETVAAVIARLKEQGLVDDLAFAHFWAENRQAFSPRSRWLLRRELRAKGVSGEVIEQAVAEIDDGEGAYRAAIAKAPKLATADYEGFRKRLGDYLKRRGFGYEIINNTLKRVWEEVKE